MDEAIESVVIHFGGSSNYTHTNEGESCSSSEDERIEEIVEFYVCLLFKVFTFFK
jgi:hypothetical protein